MKILIVGSSSILSKAIFRQHLTDEMDVLYYTEPPAQLLNCYPISELKNLKDDYDFVYIVSAIISDKLEDNGFLYQVNVELVREISSRFPKSKLIYFSSVAVYDGLCDKKIDENTFPSPESIYGISKLWAEKIVSRHKKFSILRISSMYGTEMKNTTFLPRIIEDALLRGRIRLIGNGTRKQNYVCADDVALLAKKLAILNENKIQLAISKLSYSNSEVAEIIRNETDCTISYEGTDVSRSVEYAQNTFPYLEYNLTTLEKGIKELIEWKRKQF